ncbi:MAG: Flp pilus assembly complex ATPase component TadA, partial [Candidatus Eisenbacteria sp.]|nr:Flp pilus assembly complex ATPase component TadA [Candidatus Eisenbacteria bacterium]
LLIEAGVITAADLESALATQRGTGERLGEALVKLELATEIDIVDALAGQLGLEQFDPVAAGMIDPEVVLTIPEHMARHHRALAVEQMDNELVVAMSDPLDLVAIDDLKVVTKCELSIQVGLESDVESAIVTAYRRATADQNLEEVMEGAEVELGIQESAGLEELSEEELRERAEDAPIVKLVNLILGQGIAERATDIHIEPLEKKVVVRYRVDGVLYDATTPPKRFHEAIVVRIKILSDMDVAERRLPLDGRFTVRFENQNVDVRVSSLPTIYGEKVAMRLLHKSGTIVGLAELGFEEDAQAIFRKALKRPYGMVLISGPTGSGKSTTLYAGMGELDRVGRNITTLEDPVEYHIGRVNQVNVNRKAGMTFSTGLRSILRQDPDIIMVGEVRDLETAELAIRSALTGHLVLSTVHANDAPSTATRLVDIGIEPYLVTSAIHLVMAQRLVRRICPHCAEPYKPDPNAVIALVGEVREGAVFHRGTGCKHCKGRGFLGRTAIFEMLEITPELSALVMKGVSADVLRKKALEAGFVTLRENAAKKALDGITTVEEALGVSTETM